MPGYPLEILTGFSTVIFALTGVAAVRGRGLDLFGVVTVACVTAVGGGTLRDAALGVKAFWLDEPSYLYLPVATAIIGFYALRLPWARAAANPYRLLLLLDAVGLALFTVLGTEKAMRLGVSWGGCLVLGLLTGVGGGLLRDVLANRIPLLLRKEVYAVASLLGAAVVVVSGRGPWGLAAGFAACLVLRIAAIHRNLSLPVMPR